MTPSTSSLHPLLLSSPSSQESLSSINEHAPPVEISSPSPSHSAEQDAIVREVLARVTEHLSRQTLPVATYRVQMNRDFTLSQAAELIPYLHDLGITDLYSSPLLKAVAGSNHGYDVVAHDQINPEIGTSDDLVALSSQLRSRKMGFILDIVPNHMSVATRENLWWNDVLENGPSSPYAGYFDIDWMPLKPDLANKVLLPVLGDQFGKVLEAGELKLICDEGNFHLETPYGRFPIAPRTYSLILSHRLDELRSSFSTESHEFQEYLSILTSINNLPLNTETSPERIAERIREKEVIKRRLRQLIDGSPLIADFIVKNLTEINGRPELPESFNRLDEILEKQAYRLAYWRVAADEINYRRFFDINSLAAICMEKPDVFAATHRLVFDWLRDGLVTGLRIDHPDGLFDPSGYFLEIQRTRFLQLCREQMTPDIAESPDAAPLLSALEAHWTDEPRKLMSPLSRPVYTVVEKILEHGEPFPADWQVHGTVGYEFLNSLNDIFVDPLGEKNLSATYTRLTGADNDFSELAYICKRLNVRHSMSSELNVLAHQLDRISEQNRWTRDLTLNSLARSLQELIACFGIYRTYVQQGRVSFRDRRFIEEAVAQAKARHPEMSEPAFDFIRDMLLTETRANADDAERQAIELFVGKFQQLTGPIMAKAIEDTAFYRYARLLSLNEVGGSPEHFGSSPAEFHRLNRRRLPVFSHSLSSTSTHDTKRSEDVRARINVLSEVSREWSAAVSRWMRRNQSFKNETHGEVFPSRNDEYFLYQTLIGIWPEEGVTHSLLERLRDYLVKAAREAKLHTSWINPNVEYESALTQFLFSILESKQRRTFLKDLENFAIKVRTHGRWNSLSQLLLKIASPGVPDFYQGTELETLTLVDPDNRHPVDYTRHYALLEEISRFPVPLSSQDAAFLLHPLSFDLLKLFLTRAGLHTRRDNPQLFTSGEYIPLEVRGTHSDSVVAILRKHGDTCALAVVPRLTVRVTGFGGPAPTGELWKDTTLLLPQEFRSHPFQDVLTGAILPSGDQLPLSIILKSLPVALAISSPSRQEEA